MFKQKVYCYQNSGIKEHENDYKGKVAIRGKVIL